jgi:hypothetical protein
LGRSFLKYCPVSKEEYGSHNVRAALAAGGQIRLLSRDRVGSLTKLAKKTMQGKDTSLGQLSLAELSGE